MGVRALRLIATILILSLGLPAQANILLEPYGGFQAGGGLDLKSFSTASSGSFNSAVYGGRLGLDIRGFFIGGEYLADTNTKVKFSSPNLWGTADVTASMTNTNLGGFLGVEIMHPFLLRIYGTFFAASDAHLTNPGATKDADIDIKGYGYKAEIDSRLHKYLSLGVSYYWLIGTKWIDNSTKASTPAIPVNKQQSLMLTLSVPLEI